MNKEKEFKDTLSSKTYMAVGSIVNLIFRFASRDWRHVHLSYQHPGFFYGLGNIIFAVFLINIVIGIPVVIMMIITFKRYNAKTQYRIYLITLIIAALGYGGVLYESVFPEAPPPLVPSGTTIIR